MSNDNGKLFPLNLLECPKVSELAQPLAVTVFIVEADQEAVKILVWNFYASVIM